MPRKKTTPASPPLPNSHSSAPPAITNLEMRGDQLKVFTLHTLLTNKKRKETRDAARLGDVLLPWFEKTVAKPAAKLDGIAELWQTLVPDRVVSRSRSCWASIGHCWSPSIPPPSVPNSTPNSVAACCASFKPSPAVPYFA